MRKFFQFFRRFRFRKRLTYREAILREKPVAYYPLGDTLDDIAEG